MNQVLFVGILDHSLVTMLALLALYACHLDQPQRHIFQDFLNST